jgi:hypothetical protein
MPTSRCFLQSSKLADTKLSRKLQHRTTANEVPCWCSKLVPVYYTSLVPSFEPRINTSYLGGWCLVFGVGTSHEASWNSGLQCGSDWDLSDYMLEEAVWGSFFPVNCIRLLTYHQPSTFTIRFAQDWEVALWVPQH